MKKKKREDKGQTSILTELEKIDVAKKLSERLRKLPIKRKGL